MKRFVPFFYIICLFVLGVGLTNTRTSASSGSVKREFIAHRGLHQTFNPVGVTNKTCTAQRIENPVHNYIENTLSSIDAAIKLGATIIEFDIHPTSDGEFVIFHDWNLECRTNGKGVTRAQNLAYLKKLDIGHGYTADGGKTFPFRGQYIGAMPSLGEVLLKFPKMNFLINIKSRDSNEAVLLTSYLKQHKTANRQHLSVYGSGPAVLKFAALNKDIKTLIKEKAKTCLKSYILWGWSGHVPTECANSLVPVPVNYRSYIWGWPHKFTRRLKKIGSRPVLVGPHKKGKANSGVDDIETFRDIDQNYNGLILTNRIDLLAKQTSSSASKAVLSVKDPRRSYLARPDGIRRVPTEPK